jgi:hypothetical protein
MLRLMMKVLVHVRNLMWLGGASGWSSVTVLGKSTLPLERWCRDGNANGSPHFPFDACPSHICLVCRLHFG